MLKNYIISISIGVGAMLFLSTAFAKIFELDPSDDAVSACVAHSEKESCSYRDENGVYVSGNCVTYNERHKVCSNVRPSR